ATKAGASKESVGEAIDAMPQAAPSTNVNFAPAKIDTSRNVLGIDLGNALPFKADATPANSGTLAIAIATATGPINLGTIDNTLANYLDRAYLFELPLGNNTAAAQSNPIVMTSNGGVVLTENPSGAWIDADEHVYRMDAS